MASRQLDVERPSPLTTLRVHEAVMGTIVTIDVYDDEGIERLALRTHLDEARAQLQLADQIFSTWREDTPMSRLRRGEIGPDDAPPEVTEVLARCRVARSLSGGWFDPWAMPGGVDPTGYVKGWAAQRALKAIAASGVTGAVVNAAGDVATFGGPSAGTAFRVGIEHPVIRKTLACVVELAGAIATSGAYERGAHLVDPHSGLARCCVASASVCGPDLGLADALATALAVGGDPVLDRLEELDAYEGLVIDQDGSMRATSSFPFAGALSETTRRSRQRR